MKGFGKETAIIAICGMVQFAIKQADITLREDASVRVDIPFVARRFCKGEEIQFEKNRKPMLDPIGEGILTTCEEAKELSIIGGNVARILEAAKITVAEVLTELELRKVYKGTQVPNKLKVAFLGAFNNLLQYKFLGGEN